jgi:hypothetical protein
VTRIRPVRRFTPKDQKIRIGARQTFVAIRKRAALGCCDKGLGIGKGT